jgi:hypothetical protein
MNKTILIALIITHGIFACTQTKKKTTQDISVLQLQIFEFKNDSLSQIMELSQISDDTLKINLKTINKIRNTSCVLEGLAIHDTIGDFLNEEETVEIEGNEVIPIKYFTFLDNKTSIKIIIGLDISTKDKLIFQGPNSGFNPKTLNCLFNSIGTLRKK